MAIEYFPFDDGPGANSTESRWTEMMRKAIGTGVFSGELNEFEVYADATGMLVKVESGKAWLEGHMVISTAEEELVIAANASGNPRIDRVVLRLDWAANSITLAVKQGVAAGAPAAPALQQDAAIWEVSLAQVAVDDAAPNIAAVDVTDERTYAANAAGSQSLSDLFDANTILKADADDTPAALTIAEQRLVGRITGGVITALTAAQVKTLLAITSADVSGVKRVEAKATPGASAQESVTWTTAFSTTPIVAATAMWPANNTNANVGVRSRSTTGASFSCLAGATGNNDPQVIQAIATEAS